MSLNVHLFTLLYPLLISPFYRWKRYFYSFSLYLPPPKQNKVAHALVKLHFLLYKKVIFVQPQNVLGSILIYEMPITLQNNFDGFERTSMTLVYYRIKNLGCYVCISKKDNDSGERQHFDMAIKTVLAWT